MVAVVGGDAVVLVFREAAASKDSLGGARITDRTVAKSGWAFEEETPSETNTAAPVAKLRARAFGPCPDPETAALTEDDAIRYRGRTFELLGIPQLWTDLDGNPDHYEVLCEWTDNARTE